MWLREEYEKASKAEVQEALWAFKDFQNKYKIKPATKLYKYLRDNWKVRVSAKSMSDWKLGKSRPSKEKITRLIKILKEEY